LKPDLSIMIYFISGFVRTLNVKNYTVMF